jgi:hypothetical protein
MSEGGGRGRQSPQCVPQRASGFTIPAAAGRAPSPKTCPCQLACPSFHHRHNTMLTLSYFKEGDGFPKVSVLHTLLCEHWLMERLPTAAAAATSSCTCAPPPHTITAAPNLRNKMQAVALPLITLRFQSTLSSKLEGVHVYTPLFCNLCW